MKNLTAPIWFVSFLENDRGEYFPSNETMIYFSSLGNSER
jgi:hypothetical protein